MITTDVALTADATSRFVEVDGLTVHLHDTGFRSADAEKNSPLVLLHGGGPGAAGWSNFSRNIAALAAHFRVIVVDQIGYGQTSTRIPVDGVWRAQARLTDQLLDELAVDKAHFAGNSLGGGASMRLAIDFPERVDRLILMGSAGGLTAFAPGPTEGTKALAGFYAGSGPSVEKMRRLVSLMVHDSALVTDQVIAERYAAAMQPHALEFGNWMYRAGGRPGVRLEDIWRDVDRIPHKTLLVWGRDDRVVPLDSALFLLRRLRDAELHVFSRCGHWAQIEHSEAFNALATHFLTAS